MKIALPAALLLIAVCWDNPVAAQRSSGTYPPVYGSNGQLYGPTQAHYQYYKQYGRPWDGTNGLPGGVGPGYVNGYPGGGRHYHAGRFFCRSYFYPPVYYYGGFDYASYGGFSYASPWTLIAPLQTQIPADHQAVLNEWLQDGERQWKSPLESMPVEELPRRFIKPSTAEAQAVSVRLQHAGDLQFQQLKFSNAASDYQDALMAAQDRSEPYFRLALAKAAIFQFDDAVLNLKLGLQLDPDWPRTGPQLIELFGEHNLLRKKQFKQQLLGWVQEDIRDPERLFLLGVVLHMDNDVDRAAEILEAAARLGGMKQHLHAFLIASADDAQAVNLQGGQQPVEAAPPPAPGEDVGDAGGPVIPTPPVRPAAPPGGAVFPPPLPE